MRLGRIPQNDCGKAHALNHAKGGRWSQRVVLCAVLTGLATALASTIASAPARAQSSPTFDTPRGGLLPSTKIDRSQPLYLQGDQLIYDTDGDSVTARGNVEIFYNDYILTADEVVYSQSSNTLTAVGNVLLKEPNGNIIRADRYTLTDDFRDGFIESLRVTGKDDTKISAARATRRDGNITEFTDGKFTPCRTDGGAPPLWCISSKRIIHDQAAATITYQDAAFEVLGVPIFYLPYFQHADPTVKRRSGFLLPQYSSSDDLGVTVEVPYYFALADNYDFTFRPMYTTKQGILWQGDWRHRLANGQYNIKLAGIDQDSDDLSVSNAQREELDGWRGSVETKGLFSLSSWWKLGWDVTVESDDTFRRFYRLDHILLTDRVNTTFLVGQSDRNYFGASLYHFGGLLLDDTPQAESRAHPVIDYNYVVADPVLGGELKWDTNVLSFSRGDFDGANTSQQDLNRAVTELTWRKKLIDTIGITYTPFAYLRGDIYQLNNFVNPLTSEPIAEESIARGVAGGGVTVAYPWAAHTNVGTHVIEPIGQIIARQDSVSQDRLPNEDAKSLIFDDTNLFSIDKFSGYDRVETGTRANVGVQYTFQPNWGGHARLLAGQSFHLAGRNSFSQPGVDADGNLVNNPASGLDTDNSDYILGAYLSPSDSFLMIGQSRFDQNDFDLRRQDLYVSTQYGPFHVGATYAYEASNPALGILDAEQDVAASGGIQLTDRWSISGSIRYDIDEEFRLSDAIRLRYADECFVLTASYVETFINDPERDISPDRTVYLRFELKHLGDFQYKTDALDFVFSDDQPPT